MATSKAKPKATTKKSGSSAPKIEDRYKKELPPIGSAKYKSYVLQGLIKAKQGGRLWQRQT